MRGCMYLKERDVQCACVHVCKRERGYCVVLDRDRYNVCACVSVCKKSKSFVSFMLERWREGERKREREKDTI